MYKNNLFKTVIIFVALTIVGVSLVVFGLRATDAYISTVLSLLGTGIFTAGLSYFLLRVG